jgi:hypothetical protein
MQLVQNALTRRAIGMRPGAAGLHNVASPTAAAIKQGGKRNKKKGDVNKRCKLQAKDWSTFVTTTCEGDPGCLQFLTCAEPLKTCNFTDFIDCFTTTSTS